MTRARQTIERWIVILETAGELALADALRRALDRSKTQRENRKCLK